MISNARALADWTELSDNFTANPDELNQGFTLYCAAEGLLGLRFPLDFGGFPRAFDPHEAVDWRATAEYAIAQGWLKLPPGLNRAPRPEDFLVCNRAHRRHDFVFNRDEGDICARCGAKPSRAHNRAAYAAEDAEDDQAGRDVPIAPDPPPRIYKRCPVTNRSHDYNEEGFCADCGKERERAVSQTVLLRRAANGL